MDTSTPNRTFDTAKAGSVPVGRECRRKDSARTRRAALLVLVGACMMTLPLLWPGATVSSSERDRVVYGGSGADEMWATQDEGGSALDARGGDDEVFGGAGEDVIFGGAGDDFIEVSGGRRDRVTCGPGADLVNADSEDIVAGDCETVYVTPTS